jgi:DNA polymerase-1
MCGVILLRIKDGIAGQRIRFHYVESRADFAEFKEFIGAHKVLALDTESTGINCYVPGWSLRMAQFGNAVDSYVVPAEFQRLISWAMDMPVKWIGHNGPHDIRSIDEYLGYETGVVCAGETYIPSHHEDSRNQQEGGVGHGLKELAIARVDRDAGKWEKELKALFRTFKVAVPGEFFNSGPRKGQPKTRNARQAEGWKLVSSTAPAYIAYAGADPILTYRVWETYQPTVKKFHDLYEFDHEVQIAVDRLQRRAILLDVDYTERLSKAYTRKAERAKAVAASYGCDNVNSNDQIARVLVEYGAKLTAKTKTGKLSTTNTILRKLLKQARNDLAVSTGNTEHQEIVIDFIRAVLLAKQCDKRREAYTDAMLRERDENNRVHPSINALAARTTRMSVSNPALQQLPTKDRADDETE